MVKNNIVMEGTKIVFRNFSGKEGQYNVKGDRNFCVLIDSDLAAGLLNDGWNVRYLRPKNEGDIPQAYLQVAVSFGKFPPKIVQVTSHGKTELDEEDVKILDWAEIKSVDLVIRPYNWITNEKTKNEKRGVKAYLKTMFVTIAEEDFADKYYDIPDSADGAIGGCGKCESCDGNCKHHGDQSI